MTTPFYLDTPIGVLTIESDGEAITHITLPDEHTKKPKGPTVDDSRVPKVVKLAVEQLTEYFAGKRTEFDLPLEVDGTEFQKDVWMTLADIPYGKTISYAELAGMVGRPTAFRAVGQANGANPIPIVLPCHRVIATGGGIGGYGGGLEMKQKLLALEGIDAIR
jgi:methylated-DNA-[protein]-cysteine S-methyltransferase